MFKHIYRSFGEQQLSFEVAFQRVEAQRLISEGKLRKLLTKYWAGDRRKLATLRPMDVLVDFQSYAEDTYRAVASECSSLFADLESYDSFLYFVREWVVEEILPKVRESMLAAGHVQELNPELVHLANPEFLELIRRVAERKDGVDRRSVETLAEILTELRTIRLQQGIATFTDSIEGLADDHEWEWIRDNAIYDGDWECLIAYSLQDADRTISPWFIETSLGKIMQAALRSRFNREAAKEFLCMTLEQMTNDLLALWRQRAAEDHHSGAGSNPSAPPKDSAGRIPGARAGIVTPPAGWGKRPRVDAGIEKVKMQIRDLKEARVSHKEICDRLGAQVRPANAAWKHLFWSQAFKDPHFRPAVKSWISRV